MLGGAKIGDRAAAAGRPERAARTLAPSDVRHPVLQAFAGRSSLGLGEVPAVRRRSRGRAVRRWRGSRSGRRRSSTATSGEGRALVLASDLDNRWNDFPLHATFVPFVHESVALPVAGASRAVDYSVGAGAGRGCADARRRDRAAGGRAGRPFDCGERRTGGVRCRPPDRGRVPDRGHPPAGSAPWFANTAQRAGAGRAAAHLAIRAGADDWR